MRAAVRDAREAWAALNEQPATAEERDFCDIRMNQRNLSVARLCMFVAVGYHSVSLFTDRIVVSPEDLTIFTVIQVSFLAAHALWWAYLRRTRIGIQTFLWCLQAAFIASMGYVLWRTTSRPSLADTVLSSSGLLMTSSIMLLMCPFGKRRMLFTAALYIAIAGLAFSQHHLGERWILIDALVITAIAATQYHSELRIRAMALHEYRTLRRVAPAQVVRQAVTEQKSLEASFHPQLRTVACVSSDWRNYQEFSRSKEPDVVARTLSAYYTLCNQILEDVAPQGNFYSDWIADELFVVFFGRYGAPSRTLAAQALEFSRRLILAKPAFLAEHSMPRHVDLGISVGSAFVGMMGPKDHYKATALGETPGLARRLQSSGKLLRARLGEKDRVIVDTNVVAWLGKNVAFGKYELEGRERLRDLEASVLHFAEVETSVDLKKEVDADEIRVAV